MFLFFLITLFWAISALAQSSPKKFLELSELESSEVMHEILKEYQGIGFDEKALARAAYSAYKLGDPTKARKYSTQLKANPIKDDRNKSLVKEIKL